MSFFFSVNLFNLKLFKFSGLLEENTLEKCIGEFMRDLNENNPVISDPSDRETAGTSVN